MWKLNPRQPGLLARGPLPSPEHGMLLTDQSPRKPGRRWPQTKPFPLLPSQLPSITSRFRHQQLWLGPATSHVFETEYLANDEKNASSQIFLDNTFEAYYI